MILSNWSDEHTEKFRKESFKVKHNLMATGLFSDDALAELLDKHPKDQLDVCTLSDHPVFQYKFRTGDVRGVDGKTLIEAVKAGSIWMNLRKAMNIHPEYNAVLKQMYGELAELTGSKPFHARGAILISSPTAKVPMHFDATETILWHVRGHKRMFLFPKTQEYLPDEEYEKLMYRVTEDYLPYQTSMDEAATIYDLYDDEMVTWPLNQPHRVENKTYCVSVTTEYSTPESTMKNAAMYTNAVLRRKFGMSPSWQSASAPEKFIKAGAGKVLRKIGLLDTLKAEDLVTFKIDKTVPGFIRDVDSYVRNF